MDRESWIMIHGSVLGTLILLGFAGGLAGLIRLQPRKLSAGSVRGGVRGLKVAVVTMAVAVWGTVLTGTWVIYPWYREAIPQSPRSILLANPATEQLHHFGMEWKEHVAWISPILATVVAFIVIYYGTSLVRHERIHRTALLLFSLAFLFAVVAGTFGTLIAQEAPVL
ncbi:MAG: hypothetical protein ABIP19_05970 [Dermatophilaceae bacterium]